MATKDAKNTQGVVNSWTLLAFAASHGRMKVAPFINKATTPPTEFKSCVFEDREGNYTFVGFSSNLGELTPKEISDNKDKLQVVQLASGSYKLCAQGQSTWEDVDL